MKDDIPTGRMGVLSIGAPGGAPAAVSPMERRSSQPPHLWAPTPPSAHADGAAHRQRWHRRTWQLHQSVLLSHLYAFALLVGYSWAGYAPWRVIALYGAWVGAGMGFITWAYASGWNHRQRDPGLFVVHQGVSILGALGLLVAAPQLAFQALVMLIAFSADGFLARSRTSFAVTWVLTLACAGAGIVWMGPEMRMPTTTLAGQLLTVGVVLGAVARCIGLVTYFRGVQYRLGQALARIEDLVRSDDLTGVANRRGIMEALRWHHAQTESQGRPLSVALLDVDHFKRINDDFGHDSGDRVLRTLGTLLREQARATDGVGRYGGEEFLLVLPGTSAAQASEVLERLRARVETTAWAAVFEGAAGVTVSIGATVCRPGESVEAAVRRADEALYEGKALGRNRVVMA